MSTTDPASTISGIKEHEEQDQGLDLTTTSDYHHDDLNFSSYLRQYIPLVAFTGGGSHAKKGSSFSDIADIIVKHTFCFYINEKEK